jgi:hypothetical protein
VTDTQPGIRAWYAEKTRLAVRGVVLATLVSLGVAGLGFLLVPKEIVLHAQIFNGAFVIPVFGGIWIAAFVILWLVPMREVSFRGQEAMERIEGRVDDLHKRAVKILDSIEGGTHPIAKKVEDTLARVEGHMAAIRARIERDTNPLPVIRRPIEVPDLCESEEKP